MDLLLKPVPITSGCTIKISGSKSETNRLLLLQALFPQINIRNISNSDDSVAMKNAIASKAEVIDIGHAGTAMRFLTAYFAIQQGRKVTLTGSSRMQERPIKILVDALQQLGADIQYSGKRGFPPLQITGKRISASETTIEANISSQYISALLLIAPKLENGLRLKLSGELTSAPYIRMTLGLLNQIGVDTSFEDDEITIKPGDIKPKTITVESDWSSASYFYSVIALSDPGASLTLSSFQEASLQGDSALSEIYLNFGVATTFNEDKITLTKTDIALSEVNFNLKDTPDLAQTIAVTAFGLGVKCTLSGLHTLAIKETDRLQALESELTKLGAAVKVSADTIEVIPFSIKETIRISTFGDHRMAMAFAPLAIRIPIIIQDAGVVAKSSPEFWDNLKTLGFSISKT
ncbi:MAG TPA: 3-phosphoshikimate 1-carboxyvinyltransferase [Flavobacterium sp.]